MNATQRVSHAFLEHGRDKEDTGQQIGKSYHLGEMGL